MSTKMQPIAPIHVLWQRIAYHAAPGRMLEGLKLQTSPTVRQEGPDDLPSIEPIDYIDSESMFAGAKTSPDSNSNVNLSIEARVIFMVSARRKYGLYQIDPASGKGILDWVTLIRDAMELDQNGNPDSTLKGTCDKPMLTSARDNVVLEDSWRMGIEVTLFPRAFIRGTRRDPMDT